MMTRSRCPGSLSATRIMFFILAFLLASAVAAPATYDQRQDGEDNMRIDMKNTVVFLSIPHMSIPIDTITDTLLQLKPNKHVSTHDISDVQIGDSVESSTLYNTEMGSDGSEGSPAGDEHIVEVVITDGKRSDVEPQPEEDEIKLLGATEQCGPDRVRDSVTLICRQRSEIQPEKTPEVISS